jgi:hypothetical protein
VAVRPWAILGKSCFIASVAPKITLVTHVHACAPRPGGHPVQFVPDDSCDASPIGCRASPRPIMAKVPLTAIGSAVGFGRTSTMPRTMSRRSEHIGRGPWARRVALVLGDLGDLGVGTFLRGVAGWVVARQSGVAHWAWPGSRSCCPFPLNVSLCSDLSSAVSRAAYSLPLLGLETCPFA